MFAVLASEYGEDFSAFTKAHEILEHPLLARLMRDELGMFKTEQADFAKAIHMRSILSQRKLWEGRGERRRQAVVSSPAFPLALKLAERDFLLSPDDLNFWQTSFKDLARPAGPRTGRPRRRRRKPRAPR